MSKRNTALAILNILQKYRRIRGPHNHHYSIEPFVELVMPFVTSNLPFKMLLPAFHCKSINPHSVLGSTPDGAEEMAIDTLTQLCEEIQTVYGPGCELLIVHEGHFYSDIGITPSDAQIDEYENCIHAMTKCPMIHFTNILKGFCSDSYEEARKIVFDKYMTPLEEIEAAVAKDESIKSKYIAYKAFIVHEFAPILMAENTNREIRDKSRVLAYQWLQRYLVFKKLCGEMFGDFFRLSVLAYPSKSKSFGVNLILNASEFGLPWFHVLLKKKDGSIKLMKKSQAEKAGYKLVFKNGQPWNYTE